MYQSPVAAVAELVANAWDADSAKVFIELPDQLNAEADLIVARILWQFSPFQTTFHTAKGGAFLETGHS